ncbi:sigma-70 family RNA polymerase sigma factor [Clostridium fungisolvens]|uniref:RNA polymerase sigma factor n=1 Tax=Clostridium fungisolvens TaxID=1604897 RepID=A0A6V8SME1_9CLOT|nr:sigma-70 family RNA polymerase sigma factor [Clostridium fungisolvens]GFP77735.1 RNA polymerase sigma factor SigY [Clostridium fungisolvens]
MEEQDVLIRAKCGDKQALSTLIENNYKTLNGFIIKLTGDIYLSEDLLQETLMKAIINIKSYRGESKFSTWLIKIALNIYRNNYKRQKKIKFDELNEKSYISTGSEIEDKIQAKMQVEEVLKELQSLSYEKRVTFILKHYYGYSLEEISNIMGCAEGTVKSRLHNTAKGLKNIFKLKEGAIYERE